VRSRFGVFWERFWGWLLVLGAVVGGLHYYQEVREQEARSQCQQRYNAAFTESLRIRSESTGKRQDAVDAVLSGVGELALSGPVISLEGQEERRQRFAELFRRYNEVVRENDADRAANPLPDFPDC
jgi:hypothetical protein